MKAIDLYEKLGKLLEKKENKDALIIMDNEKSIFMCNSVIEGSDESDGIIFLSTHFEKSNKSISKEE